MYIYIYKYVYVYIYTHIHIHIHIHIHKHTFMSKGHNEAMMFGLFGKEQVWFGWCLKIWCVAAAAAAAAPVPAPAPAPAASAQQFRCRPSKTSLSYTAPDKSYITSCWCCLVASISGTAGYGITCLVLYCMSGSAAVQGSIRHGIGRYALESVCVVGVGGPRGMCLLEHVFLLGNRVLAALVACMFSGPRGPHF